MKVTSYVPGCVYFDFDGTVLYAEPDDVRPERVPGTGHLSRGGVGFIERCTFPGAPRPLSAPLKRKVIWMHEADVEYGAVEASLAYVAVQVAHLRSLPAERRPSVIVWHVGDVVSDKGIVESYVAVDEDFEDEVFDDMYAPEWIFKKPDFTRFEPTWVHEIRAERNLAGGSNLS